MRQTRIEIGFGSDALEGIMCGPESPQPPLAAVAVCHPHPLLGGNADNPVIYAICDALARTGIMSLRFNFTVASRDTEALISSAAREVVETSLAIADWEGVSSRRIGVAGYSFGSAAALRALPDLGHVAAISLIAPPVSAINTAPIDRFEGPLQVISGSADRLVRQELLMAAVETADRSAGFVTIDGADHSFHGYADDVATTCARFMRDSLLS